MKLVDDETKALLWAGFIRPFDIIILITLSIMALIGLTWILARPPELVYIVLYLFSLSVLGWIWLLSVVYRSCYFSLKCYAEMQVLPDRAGAVAHQLLVNSSAAAKAK